MAYEKIVRKQEAGELPLKNDPMPGEAGLEDSRIRELQKRVDALCREIAKDISLENFFTKEKKLKEFCLERFPDKAGTYDLIYRSRFKRLWEQLRNARIEFKEE